MLRFGLPLGILTVVLIVVAGLVHAPPAIQLCLGVGLFISALSLGFVLFFFRDPERVVPPDPAIIVSAADGLVVGVEEMDEPDFQLGRRLRISVFLSVFDVHVNRSPVAGRVLKTEHKAGEFLDVRHPECSTRNEALSWLLETEQGPVAVRQIAGLGRAADCRLVAGRLDSEPRGAFWHDPFRLPYGGFSYPSLARRWLSWATAFKARPLPSPAGTDSSPCVPHPSTTRAASSCCPT